MEFRPFPSIPRLSRQCVITEKLDGTNASVHWVALEGFDSDAPKTVLPAGDPDSFLLYRMLVGSKNRLITPDDDNFGFAKWAYANVEELAKLGPGSHYGEWWGQGIQRNYGLKEKRFSLFNTKRWRDPLFDYVGLPNMEAKVQDAPACCSVVPILRVMNFCTNGVLSAMMDLAETGSRAAPGFHKPEGVVVYHTAVNWCFKKTFENDEEGKWGGHS